MDDTIVMCRDEIITEVEQMINMALEALTNRTESTRLCLAAHKTEVIVYEYSFSVSQG